VGVFLTLAALVGSVAFWVNTTDTRPVLVAVHDLPAGATLRGSDVAVAYVKVDDSVYRAATPADMLDALVGRQLSEPVHENQILARAQLATQFGLAADQVAMTVPARPESAVDGQLRPGDAVEVFVTVVDKTRGQAHSTPVLDRARVYAVGRDQSLASSSSSSNSDSSALPRGAITDLTLAVTVDQARQLAEARRIGELDIVLLPTGTPPNSQTAVSDSP
jgi:Flp pilus assembly protein CpaB